MVFKGLLFALERKPIKYSISQENVMSNYVSENEQANQILERDCCSSDCPTHCDCNISFSFTC